MVEGPHAIQPEEQPGDRARLRVVRRRGESAPTLMPSPLDGDRGARSELGGRLEAVTVAYRTWGRSMRLVTTRSLSSTR